MAHADYHCCAICDKKISFGGFDATTKEQICSECVANLAERGVIVHDITELIEWIKREEPLKVATILRDVGFRFCYYDNIVDKMVEEKIGDIITKNDDRTISLRRGD
mgnify:CR=1 FL=1